MQVHGDRKSKNGSPPDWKKGIGRPYLERERGPSELQQLPGKVLVHLTVRVHTWYPYWRAGTHIVQPTTTPGRSTTDCILALPVLMEC